jgi:hypothetical protein
VGEQSPVKYHYLYRFFTYSMKQGWSSRPPSCVKPLRAVTWVEDIVRWGVWLGRHIC